jgi:hypothetical protein
MPGVFAVGIRAGEYVAPELLCDGAALAVRALALCRLALGAVAQEEQPPLLLRHVLLFALHLHLHLHARVHVPICTGRPCKAAMSAVLCASLHCPCPSVHHWSAV